MKTPLVAIIGLPNAGKSTLFNKILEIKKALTHEEAGTTRDRHYGLTSWNGLSFYLVDTAGIAKPNSPLEKNIQKQTAIALEESDLIMLVVDGKTPVSSQDLAVATRLNRSGKPTVLAASKIDNRSNRVVTMAADYARLGLNQPILVSGVNGTGVGDLLDDVVTKLKATFGDVHEEEDAGRLKVAFIGKPNVGKSSLINALLKQERLLVDSKAGTTRSTVDIPFEFKDRKFVLLDTAGVKKKWKQDIDIETAAAMQSLRTIPKVDVALFVVDATTDMTFQDQAIAEEIIHQNKSILIVINKIDLLDRETRDRFIDRLPDYLPQLWWAPVVFTSAETGEGLEKMLELAQASYDATNKEIDIAALDNFYEKIVREHKPGKMDDEREPKLYNFKQVGTNPPIFKLTVNFPSAIAPAWRKFFEKQFRLEFGFEGTPVVFKYAKRA